MFHRNLTARRVPTSSHHGPHPPPQQTPRYEYSPRGLEGANSFHVLDKERLPPYEWSPPPTAPIIIPPHTPGVTNGRKRHSYEYGSHSGKRQCLDSSPHPSVASPPVWDIEPPRYSVQPVAESSRSSLVGFNPFPLNPLIYHQPQGHTIPESSRSLQFYAKDKVGRQMVELFEACQQQSSDLDRKEGIRAQLQQDIQQVYAVARLYLTGSSMNDLGCRSSDADLCLVIKGNKKHDPLYVLSQLKREFRSLSYVERIQLIRAKVPILRFKETSSDLEFDLNINNTVGIRNTFLLKSYAHADLRTRPLILVVKKWAQHHHINDASKGTLSSYTLVLMVLHYLQTLREPVLPCLQRDYPHCFYPFMDIDVVPEAPKHIPPYASRNQSSLGELLLGFLRYYATQFRWDKHVISVREAKTLPRTNSQPWKNKYICVEEPFEGNNVARAVHEKVKFDAIKTLFAESFRMLHLRKNLNSILPVKAIIRKEASRR